MSLAVRSRTVSSSALLASGQTLYLGTVTIVRRRMLAFASSRAGFSPKLVFETGALGDVRAISRTCTRPPPKL